MEPWDGPAALAMTDGRWVCGGLDRNGLRPMRYVVTGEGLLIAGSEVGMVPTDEDSVVEKGALGPGQMLAVDMAEGRLLHDREIKTELAEAQPFGDWVGKVTDLSEVVGGVTEPRLFDKDDLRRRQIWASPSAGWVSTARSLRLGGTVTRPAKGSLESAPVGSTADGSVFGHPLSVSEDTRRGWPRACSVSLRSSGTRIARGFTTKS